MKKKMAAVILLVILLSIMLPVTASAALKPLNVNRYSSQAQHNFWFWSSEKYKCYAQWERVSGGLNFKVKMQNDFPYDDVDAYTFEISAGDAYEDKIMLKASDGEYYPSLYYTGDKTFSPGKSGYTENFRLRAKEKIRYVYVKLIKYHTSEGTVNVDEDHQTEYYWKIN